MDVSHTLPVSQARKEIFDIIEKASQGNIYTITEKGKPRAVVMSAEEFDAWQETFEVQAQFPDLTRDIRKVKKDLASGAYKKYPTLKDLDS